MAIVRVPPDGGQILRAHGVKQSSPPGARRRLGPQEGHPRKGRQPGAGQCSSHLYRHLCHDPLFNPLDTTHAVALPDVSTMPMPYPSVCRWRAFIHRFKQDPGHPPNILGGTDHGSPSQEVAGNRVQHHTATLGPTCAESIMVCTASRHRHPIDGSSWFRTFFRVSRPLSVGVQPKAQESLVR